MSKNYPTKDDFYANVKINRDDEWVSVDCKRGLWGVSGPKYQAMSMARHYFLQYWMDGEYEDGSNG